MEYNNNNLFQGSNTEGDNSVSFNFDDSQNSNKIYFGDDYNTQNQTNSNMQNENFGNDNFNNNSFQNNSFQNNSFQENTVFNSEPQNNSFEPEKKKGNGTKVFLLILLLIIILLVICVFAMFSIKSDEQKFLELLLPGQELVNFENDLNTKALNAEQVNTSIEIDFDDIADAMNEELDGKLDLVFEMENVNKDNNQFGKFNILANKKELISLEYAKTGEIYGVRIDETTDDFIAIENKNLQEMFENMGMEDVENLPNKILTEEDFAKVMKLDENKMVSIFIEYVSTFVGMCKGKINVEENVEVNIGEQKLNTTKYSVNITEKFLYDMCVILMEELKNDKENIQMVLNDIKAGLKLMEENGYNIEEMYNISIDEIPSVKDVQEVLEDMYKELKDVDITELDDEAIIMTLSVHDYKGRNVLTELNVAGQIIRLKGLNNEEMMFSIEIESDEEIIGEVRLQGTNEKDKLEMECLIIVDEKEVKLFELKQEYIEKVDNIFELTEENALILNKASEEEVEEFMEEMEEGFEELVEDLEEKMEDMPVLEELMSSLFDGGDTVGQANRAAFFMNMGDFSDSIRLDEADLKADYAIKGEIRTNAQLYYEVATGKVASKDEAIPKGEKFNFDFLDEDEVCYQVNINNITYYENKDTICGIAGEKHYVTSEGNVFTLPGFESKQADGEIWYYVDAMGNYYVEGEDLSVKLEENNNSSFDENMDWDDVSIVEDTSDLSESKALISKTFKMYKDVEIGDTKEEVLKKIGEPTESYTSELDKNFESLYWDENNIPLFRITLYEGKVEKKEIKLESDDYKKIFIGKYVNTEVEDLNKVVTKVEDNMELAEVMSILGSTGYEISMDNWGYSDYTWYDKKEQWVVVAFDDDGKAYYISRVREP